MASYKELARDFLAIGSWVFYALVLARSLIEPYWAFATPLIAAAGVLLASTYLLTKHSAYTARAFVLVYFTTQFYQDTAFSIFAWMLFIGVPISAYINKQNTKQITQGLLIGVAAILIGELVTWLVL